MFENYNRTKLLIIFLFVLLIFILLVILIYRSMLSDKPQTEISPIITFKASPLPFLKTKPGTTTKQEVEKMGNRQSVISKADGSLEYNFPSVLTKEVNSIVVKNDVVVFEKEISTNADYTQPRLSDFSSKLGNPEKIIVGSKKYGKGGAYYIYASKGITLVVNDLSKPLNNIHEIHSYVPTSVEGYIKDWGQDIKEGIEPEGP